MMPLIPAMIGLTLAITIALAPSSSKILHNRGSVMKSNLLLFHAKSVEVAMKDNMAVGFISDALTGPFHSIGNWTSQVISGGHRTVVVTYMPEEGIAADQNTLEAFSSVGPGNLRKLPESYAGVYTYSDTQVGGMIGYGDFTDMYLPIPANSPAIITIINQEYTASGS